MPFGPMIFSPKKYITTPYYVTNTKKVSLCYAPLCPRFYPSYLRKFFAKFVEKQKTFWKIAIPLTCEDGLTFMK